MIGIIVATHDHFGEGLLQTARSIVGEEAEATTISVAPGTTGASEKFIALGQATLAKNDEVIWLIDIFGGTPFRYASQCVINDPKQHLITGVNLPMLMQALMNRQLTGETLTKLLETDSKTGIRRM